MPPLTSWWLRFADGKSIVLIIVFEHIPNAGTRLAAAQERLEMSIRSHGLKPVRYLGDRSYAKFRNLLELGRAEAEGDAFVWCNSDVELRRNPYDLVGDERVHGFFRTEIPSGEVTWGVDMYLIPCGTWDDYLSKDIPDLYCGTSFVDWWITRACQKMGVYENHIGYIDHLSHHKSGAASSMDNPYYRHNLRAYNSWAKRNHVGTVDVPVSFRRILARVRDLLPGNS